MAEPDRIVGGAWLELDGSPADHEELVLAVARRREAEPAAVAREFERVAERFEVDAVYVAPAPEPSDASDGPDASDGSRESDPEPGPP